MCEILLEPSDGGIYPGLSLGIVTEADFFTLLNIVLEDFINRTGLAWTIFSQQIAIGVTTYIQPNDLNEVKVAFVGGQMIEHSSLADLDDWRYDWRILQGTPAWWHQDGLPPKTIELAPSPDYSGATYTTPGTWGIYGLFNGAAIGQYTGTASYSGTALTWVSGPAFDANWANYSLHNINLVAAPPNGVLNQISTVTDATHLVLSNNAGTSGGARLFYVSITNDGNLTMIGPAGLSAFLTTLGQIIPVIPDSFCFYLSMGILSRIFSTDGEAKDLQRSYYCDARYSEGCAAAAAISGELLQTS